MAKKVFSIGMLAMVLALGIGTIGCDTGNGGSGGNEFDGTGVPADLVGTWRATFSNGTITYTFSGTELSVISGLTGYSGTYTATITGWANKTNTGQGAATYPSGYRLVGTVTSTTNPGTSGDVGHVSEMWIYLNTGKTAFIATPGVSDLGTGDLSPLYKIR